ncbi:MAG: cyanophycin synthetase [Pseudomonadota bacterium]
MKVIEKRFLRGPNLHSPRPCFMAEIDLEDLDEVASSHIPGFTEKLCALLPTLADHRCSLGYRGGFVERLHEGTYMAHITEHVLIELQCLAGSEVGFGKARMVKGKPRHYTIVCSYHLESLVEKALPVAIELVTATARGESYDLATAKEQNIPFFRVSETMSLFQLGWGCQQKRFQATMTHNTSYVGVEIASDKQLTKTLLKEIGLPVPQGSVVTTLEEALDWVEHRKGPWAVKPLDANQGKGVTLDVANSEDMKKAFAHAKTYGRRVIIEQYIQGNDYRVLVVGDEVIAASRRSAPLVEGDGQHTIQQLVEVENLNPLRGDGHTNVLTKIKIDEQVEAVLAKQGFTLTSILASDQVAYLRDNANLSTGGTAEDVTDSLHPFTRAACLRAAKKIGLDVAGIDIICRDITQPLSLPHGAIIEVNAAPGIRMHEWPSAGLPRHAGQAIVRSLFKEGETGRIPITAVTGTNGKTTTTLLIAKALEQSGKITGTACTEGVFINSECISKGDCTGYWSARTLLSSPDVEAAVLETARGGIIKRGLAFDRCDVSVVLNISSDHLGQNGINDLEDLAAVKRVVARAAEKTVVLNAEDAYCVEMGEDRNDGVEVFYFSMNPDLLLLKMHEQKGGRAVVFDGESIVIVKGADRQIFLPVTELPFTRNGLVDFNIANALAAVAALVAQDCPAEAIKQALIHFRSNAEENPLRMNFFEVGDITVLVDYAHNSAAYQALGKTARKIAKKGDTIAVVTAPGDRRDEDIKEIGEICATEFNKLVIYEMEDRRERAVGSTAELLFKGAQQVNKENQTIKCIPNVQSALAYAMNNAQSGDLVILGCASDLNDFYGALPQVASHLSQPIIEVSGRNG